ncbi:aminotransferase class I/II-fold pyridoxal phosphate-dependent enzyme [Mesorhizobium japonicum]|uniref:aminotransferase class I/II-fold pyridoxal phosphate-dependent enzyme n=1 Tax=Mesorhizobium japonicum TaxID=2066070 RepID=UPI003B5A969F
MAPYDGALLCIDDSHGAGAIGESGRGSLEHACLETEGNYFAGTLSKAFGALGGGSGCASCRRRRECVATSSAMCAA